MKTGCKESTKDKNILCTFVKLCHLEMQIKCANNRNMKKFSSFIHRRCKLLQETLIKNAVNGEENQRYRCRAHQKTNFSCTYFTLIQKHVFALVTWWALTINRKVLKIQSIVYTSSSSSPCFLQVNSRKLSSVIKWKDKWCRTICRTFKKRLSIHKQTHTHSHCNCKHTLNSTKRHLHKRWRYKVQ